MKLTLNQVVDQFLTDMELEGKSPETILWHRKKLIPFCKFMENEEGESAHVCDLSVADARAFIKSLMDQKTRYSNHCLRKEVEGGLAPQTIHGFARSLRTFGSWLLRERHTEEHVFEGLKPPKLPQVLIEPLTEEEIRRLLLAAPQDTEEGVRCRAILLTFLDTGIRLSELINLKMSDIDFKIG